MHGWGKNVPGQRNKWCKGLKVEKGHCNKMNPLLSRGSQACGEKAKQTNKVIISNCS